jgi:hypothetical protein
MCLDAWMTAGSGSDSDVQKLKWLTDTDNPLKEYWGTAPRKTVPLQGLKNIGKIEDMHPSHRGEYKYFSDVNNFREAIEFIYQIRCNLFHGGKSPVNVHDRRVVSLSSKVLENWIEWTLAKTRQR